LPPRYLRKVAGHGPAGKHGRDGALRNLFPANLPSTRHPNLVSLPGSELAGQQVNRCELCVHAVSRPESLQIRVGQCPIDTAASDRQQPGDHADRRAGPDSAPASVGPGSVVVGDEPPCPGRLEQRDARSLAQVVERGVGAADGDVALDAFSRGKQFFAGHLNGRAQPRRGPVAGPPRLRVG
jgi:hypothetical protein